MMKVHDTKENLNLRTLMLNNIEFKIELYVMQKCLDIGLGTDDTLSLRNNCEYFYRNLWNYEKMSNKYVKELSKVSKG